MRAILICPDETLRTQFEEATASHPSLVFSKVLAAYPTKEALTRLVRACVPEVIFLSLADAAVAETVNQNLESEFPTIQRIAIHSVQEPSIFRLALRLHMNELLVPPFDYDQICLALDQVARHLDLHPATVSSTQRFYAFVPAKAGVGASTIAANATWAFSQTPESKVLLADFDMYSGVTGFIFGVEHEFSISDAVVRKNMDEDQWHRLVKKVGNIDLLLSDAPRLGESIQSAQATQMIEFAKRNYSVVSADLADTLDETTLGVLRDASRIFLVTTPELPALRLARLKTLLFRRLDLEDKVVLLLNRVTPRMDLSIPEIEKTVGLPVFMSFPCDYADVMKGIRAGRPATKLSQSVLEFAAKLLDNNYKPEKKVQRFIERFALVPLRYGYR
jgi:MinD-like ATPase involved in chromosome partitioning or flagellar assembly